MPQIIKKRVKLDLTTIDSNTYSLMGNFRTAAKKTGWTHDEVQKVIDEAMSGDYDHLVGVLAEHCE